jgi:hypothetical protein
MAPTIGFGLVRPRAFAASLRAMFIYLSSRDFISRENTPGFACDSIPEAGRAVKSITILFTIAWTPLEFYLFHFVSCEPLFVKPSI